MKGKPRSVGNCSNLLRLKSFELGIFSILVILLLVNGCGPGKLFDNEIRWPNGNLREQWQEDRAGFKQGKATTYYKDGKKQTIGHFVNDYLEGEFVMWSQDGEELCRGIYKKGEPWSGTLVFVEEGKGKVEFITYKEGKRVD